MLPRARSATRSCNGKRLGLSIARDIIDAHGGQIWAESEPGRGASFNLVLPLTSTRTSRGSAAGGGALSGLLNHILRLL